MVNQSLLTLSKVYKEQIDNIVIVMIKTSVNCLVEVTMYYIQVLEGMKEAKASRKALGH